MTMNRRFTIRSTMVLTLVVAAEVCGLTRFNPWFDDTVFVRSCLAFEGKTIAEFVEFADANKREVLKTVDSHGTLIGLSAHARDGQFVYLFAGMHEELKSKTGSWNEGVF